MAYQAEIDEGDALEATVLDDPGADVLAAVAGHDVCLLNPPRPDDDPDARPPYATAEALAAGAGDALAWAGAAADRLPDEAVLAVLTDTWLLPYLVAHVEGPDVNFQRSIAVRLRDPVPSAVGLDDEFLSLAVFAKGYDAFSITKVRTAYRYCPACEKTTKDYGGKKHLYHSFGTLQRDVWSHPGAAIDPDDPLPESLVDRVRDTFSSGRHDRFLAVSSRALADAPPTGRLAEADAAGVVPDRRPLAAATGPEPGGSAARIDPGGDEIRRGDALDLLARVPDESADLVFLDPPYNIGKAYADYDDARDVDEYYQWCEAWLGHAARVLAPGGVVVALNLPGAVRHHARYLGRDLRRVNWLCWDALSRPPAGDIMPTNYPILVLAKGEPSTVNYRPLDGREPADLFAPEREFEYETVYPLDDAYCKRESCRADRRRAGVVDRKELTTLWTDVFRLKHNSQREDHPTMLPPKLVRRLLCVGTTTLTAAQLDRRYTGFERSQRYVDIAREKHDRLDRGVDPFEAGSASIAPPPSDDTDYKVPKKDLQLEVKRLAEELGRIPDRAEVAERGRYPIEYYDDYFDGWADATKAARTTGMTEDRDGDPSQATLFGYTD